MKKIITFLLCFSFVFPFLSFASDIKGKSYSDGHDGKVFFPLGDISFVDTVVSFKRGSPSAVARSSRPTTTLNTPDYASKKDDGYLTLGCGGSVVLQFTDNALVDVKGPDLYVFEIGPDIEPTALSVSKDNKNWVLVGVISGGKAIVDIGDYIDSEEVFRYIRLVDLRTKCRGQYPGADIDAVGAIGSGVKFSFNSAVLFDTGKYNLKPAASTELGRLLNYVKKAGKVSMVIEGHTDSVGTDARNQVLSKNRAKAVRNFLTARRAIAKDNIVVEGYGESQPIASNKTVQGRSKNRRVEIVITRKELKSSVTDKAKKKKIVGIWKTTNAGRLQIQTIISNDKAVGRYTNDKGELAGKFVTVTRFEGYWIEDKSSRKCSKPKNGRYYWGRMNLDFSSNLDSFKGTWGYCDDEPKQTNWDGKSLLH